MSLIFGEFHRDAWVICVLVWTFTKKYHKRLWWYASSSEPERWRRLYLWGSLANQSGLVGKPHSLVIDTVSENKVDSAWVMTSMVNLWSLYAYIHIYTDTTYIHAPLTQVLMCMHLLPFCIHVCTKYQEYYSVLHDHQRFILECFSLNLQKVLSLFGIVSSMTKSWKPNYGGEGTKKGQWL